MLINLDKNAYQAFVQPGLPKFALGPKSSGIPSKAYFTRLFFYLRLYKFSTKFALVSKNYILYPNFISPSLYPINL